MRGPDIETLRRGIDWSIDRLVPMSGLSPGIAAMGCIGWVGRDANYVLRTEDVNRDKVDLTSNVHVRRRPW